MPDEEGQKDGGITMPLEVAHRRLEHARGRRMPPYPSAAPNQPTVHMNDRRSILLWLQWNDRNGCYVDEACRAEGIPLLDIDGARRAYAAQGAMDRHRDVEYDQDGFDKDPRIASVLDDMLAGRFVWRGPAEFPSTAITAEGAASCRLDGDTITIEDRATYVPAHDTLARFEYMQHSHAAWRVTFAARINPGSDWTAYVCASREAVAGAAVQPHGGVFEREAVDLCLSHGVKLSEPAARALFPNVREEYRP